MKYKSSWLIGLLLATQIGFVYAQHMRLRHLTAEDGLASDYVICLLQDINGFVWIGSADGLTRYDGHHFLRKLADTQTTSILVDTQGCLWVGTYGCLSLYDPATDSFRRYLHKEGATSSLSNPYVFCLYEDKNGYIWVGTNDGMCVLDPEKGVFQQFLKSDPDHLSASRVELIAVLQDTAGCIWAGTDAGLYRMRFPAVRNPFSGAPDIRVYTESDGLSRTASRA